MKTVIKARGVHEVVSGCDQPIPLNKDGGVDYDVYVSRITNVYKRRAKHIKRDLRRVIE